MHEPVIDDDLLAILMDGVERVEELLLGALLVGDELDVIDQEEVNPAVAGAEVVDPALLDVIIQRVLKSTGVK